MISISEKDIIKRLEMDNAWWGGKDDIPESAWPKRSYFQKLYNLVTSIEIKRAVILMGPRRVGKTVIIKQMISKLIEKQSIPSENILFASIDAPVYVGMSLEQILKLFLRQRKVQNDSNIFVFFDEIQYLKDWEIHLKDLVDNYVNIKFIASGSAAAALKLKSNESGAGRFTDFMLPPLTFSEFIHFSDKNDLIIQDKNNPLMCKTNNIEKLNEAFIEYINFGGYPEVVLNKDIHENSKRFVKQDIIDKVLLRDLPSLYGIKDTRELNRLFTVLAYNTGNEVSLDGLSKESQVTKVQLRKYLEYLQAAFLIAIVSKVDESGKYFKRQRNFKVYLTNPSMRTALFSSIDDKDRHMGSIAETAIFSQWFHSREMETICYSRWRGGEVDIVKLNDRLRPAWAYEIKWSDRYFDRPEELTSLVKFSKSNKSLSAIGCSTKTKTGTKKISGIEVKFFPSSLHCYQIGRRITKDDKGKL